jgi:hypothetical protein
MERCLHGQRRQLPADNGPDYDVRARSILTPPRRQELLLIGRKDGMVMSTDKHDRPCG